MTTTDRLYPISAPADDPRFTYGLLSDAVKVLERHGYPRPESGPDLVALQEALFGFLYDLTAATTGGVMVDEPITDVGGYLSCGCHGTQRDHTCRPF
ncbi:hypothetical protein [Actinoplanes sp. CA-252034]|uniref:hypothetical protein n=1 Tax=Actinoplanes sp. CA-252034 TaxID=3239906 RepID=UPI003D9541EB